MAQGPIRLFTLIVFREPIETPKVHKRISDRDWGQRPKASTLTAFAS